ncbi:MAG TPA: MarR family winged helix-turn-helix transcriptional regulator [Vicinamibacterales bacterium]
MSPAPDPLADCAGCVCFAVRRAARAITQHYDRALRPSGLRATQFTLLTVLALAGPLPVSRAAGRLGMERTTLTRNLRPLVKQGLVTLGDGDDRRIRTLTLTARGRRAAVAALPHWRHAQRVAAREVDQVALASLQALARVLPTSRSERVSGTSTTRKERRS